LHDRSESSGLCYRCGNRIAPTKVECPKCGARQPTQATPPAARIDNALVASVAASEARVETAEGHVEAPGLKSRLFAVPAHKFVLMTIFTLGIYQFYWVYFNWKCLNKRYSLNTSPFWRATFSGVTNFELFAKVREAATVEGVAVSWHPAALAIGYLLLSVCWRLPDLWWVLSQVSFLPLLPVVLTINALPSSRGFRQGYSIGNVVVIALSAGLMALGVYAWSVVSTLLQLS
jgi:hypothetical protein